MATDPTSPHQPFRFSPPPADWNSHKTLTRKLKFCIFSIVSVTAGEILKFLAIFVAFQNSMGVWFQLSHTNMHQWPYFRSKICTTRWMSAPRDLIKSAIICRLAGFLQWKFCQGRDHIYYVIWVWEANSHGCRKQGDTSPCWPTKGDIPPNCWVHHHQWCQLPNMLDNFWIRGTLI